MKRYRLRIRREDGGSVETLVEDPGEGRCGLALIAHPHPLHGGTMDNKVVHTLARVATQLGRVAVRANFRGVGKSEGEYDHGIGETEDLLAVTQAVGAHYEGLPWCLMGFSFGSYVQHRLARRMAAERLVLVGPALSMYEFGPPPIRTDIVHGERDELIPLDIVRDYAERHGIPVHVIPDAGHFFHGRLVELKQAVLSLCRR